MRYKLTRPTVDRVQTAFELKMLRELLDRAKGESAKKMRSLTESMCESVRVFISAYGCVCNSVRVRERERESERLIFWHLIGVPNCRFLQIAKSKGERGLGWVVTSPAWKRSSHFIDGVQVSIFSKKIYQSLIWRNEK